MREMTPLHLLQPTTRGCDSTEQKEDVDGSVAPDTTWHHILSQPPPELPGTHNGWARDQWHAVLVGHAMLEALMGLMPVPLAWPTTCGPLRSTARYIGSGRKASARATLHIPAMNLCSCTFLCS